MQGQRHWKVMALLATGIALGVVIVATPATGHISGWKHNWRQHIKPKADARYYTKHQSNNRYIRSNTVGMPVAGASINLDGTVRRWFNRAGGTPTVVKGGTGSYTVTFPGLEGMVAFDNAVVSLSLTGAASTGEIRRTSTSGNAMILTSDSAGAAADRAFDMVVFVPGALLGPRPAAKGAASDEGGRR